MKDLFHSIATNSHINYISISGSNSSDNNSNNHEVCEMNCCNSNLYLSFMPTINRLVQTHKTSFFAISTNVLTAYLRLCDHVRL